MGTDYDPPTRRIPLEPQQPVAAQPGYVQVEPPEHELLRKVRSLQTGLALVGLLSALALGVALYTLLTDEDRNSGDGRRGASNAEVERLENRVSELQDDIDNRATKTSVSKLRGEQEQLSESVEQATGDDTGADAKAAADQLKTDVQELSERVDKLSQQVQQGSTGGTDAEPGATETP